MTEIAQLTSKGQRTRERIVEAAAELLFKQGMAGTTLEEVKAAAKVSSSQLYHYFDDKSDLLRAVVLHRTEEIVVAQEPVLRNLESLDGLRDWAAFVSDMFHTLEGRGCPIGSLGSEVAEYDDETREAISASLGRWEDALSEGLAKLIASGQLASTADPEALATCLIVASQGGLLLGKIHRSSLPLEIALANAIDYVASFSTGASNVSLVSPARG